MRISKQNYFSKIKGCAEEYWLDVKTGNKKTFSYYKDKYGLSGRWTDKIFSSLIHNPDAPTDHDILNLIEQVRQAHVKSLETAEQKTKERNMTKSKIPDNKPMNGDPLLSGFSARELILELRKRGYKGELTYVSKIIV